MKVLGITYGILMLCVFLSPVYCLLAEGVKRIRLGKEEYERQGKNENERLGL